VCSCATRDWNRDLAFPTEEEWKAARPRKAKTPKASKKAAKAPKASKPAAKAPKTPKAPKALATHEDDYGNEEAPMITRSGSSRARRRVLLDLSGSEGEDGPEAEDSVDEDGGLWIKGDDDEMDFEDEDQKKQAWADSAHFSEAQFGSSANTVEQEGRFESMDFEVEEDGGYGTRGTERLVDFAELRQEVEDFCACQETFEGDYVALQYEHVHAHIEQLYEEGRQIVRDHQQFIDQVAVDYLNKMWE